MNLYSKVCSKLRYWEFPEPWPTTTKDILNFVHTETLKFLPYIVALCNLVRLRTDLHASKYAYKQDLNYAWLLDNSPNLQGRIRKWIMGVPAKRDAFYGLYSSDSNRLSNVWGFSSTSVIGNFGLGNDSNEPLTLIRVFTYHFGNPLASVQSREVKNLPACVLCIPKEVIGYGI